jgi:hypothetical protein
VAWGVLHSEDSAELRNCTLVSRWLAEPQLLQSLVQVIFVALMEVWDVLGINEIAETVPAGA